MTARGILLAGIVAIFATTAAIAHSWYDPWCCNENDCQPIKDPNEVQALADGYHFRGWVMPYAKARVSADGDYHFCEYPKGELRCFYAPPGGV